ncbi:MAG: sulfotransferase family protein, partial [Alphaproteobacteria bacterium]|nr:sulfotransferase family protein [Alphaproteobacteria bacterium]
AEVIAEESMIAVFNRHNEEVRRVIPKDRLLVFQASEGWEPLCRFLGVPVPGEPFPKTNTSEEFMARSAALRTAHQR